MCEVIYNYEEPDKALCCLLNGMCQHVRLIEDIDKIFAFSITMVADFDLHHIFAGWLEGKAASTPIKEDLLNTCLCLSRIPGPAPEAPLLSWLTLNPKDLETVKKLLKILVVRFGNDYSSCYLREFCKALTSMLADAEQSDQCRRGSGTRCAGEILANHLLSTLQGRTYPDEVVCKVAQVIRAHWENAPPLCVSEFERHEAVLKGVRTPPESSKVYVAGSGVTYEKNTPNLTYGRIWDARPSLKAMGELLMENKNILCLLLGFDRIASLRLLGPFTEAYGYDDSSSDTDVWRAGYTTVEEAKHMYTYLPSASQRDFFVKTAEGS